MLWKCTLALLLGAATLAHTQELPDAPSHRFLDDQNKIMLAAGAGLLAVDAIQTSSWQNAGGREANPLARPFVSSNVAAQIVYWAGSYAATVGFANFMHRTGHHRCERFTPRLFLGIEAQQTLRNAGAHLPEVPEPRTLGPNPNAPAVPLPKPKPPRSQGKEHMW